MSDRGLPLIVVEAKDLVGSRLYVVGEKGSKKYTEHEVLRFCGLASDSGIPLFEPTKPDDPAAPPNKLQTNELVDWLPHALDCRR